MFIIGSSIDVADDCRDVLHARGPRSRCIATKEASEKLVPIAADAVVFDWTHVYVPLDSSTHNNAAAERISNLLHELRDSRNAH